MARDPFYCALYTTLGGLDGLLEAGFFEDSDDQDAPLDDIDWLCTPVTLARERLERAQRPLAVLLSTGAFGPPHLGHLDMMEVARERVEREGFDVIAGYLSPGHDEYMRLKCGDEALPATRRLELCAALIQGSDWLMVDPWEALHRRTSVNFTDVLVRLSRYLEHHLHPPRPIHLFYVCGSDNARFALTFVHQGHAVIVQRPGADKPSHRYRTHPLIKDNARVLWADGRIEASSTRARRGEHGLLPKAVTRQLELAPPHTLGLRVEGPEHYEALLSEARYEQAAASILDVIKDLTGIATSRIEVRAQRALMRGRPAARPRISLDPLIPLEHQLAISRRFDLGGYTQRGHSPRPGHPSFSAQLARLEPGEYDLFDDDIASGSTMRAASALLQEHITLIAHDSLERTCAQLELADCRDFILGSPEGGLVVELPDGTIGRAPYMLPYVDPSARCSLPGHAALPLSLRLWQLNATLYASSGLTIASRAPHQARLWLQAGHDETTTLYDLCRWHIARLCGLMGQPQSP